MSVTCVNGSTVALSWFNDNSSPYVMGAGAGHVKRTGARGVEEVLVGLLVEVEGVVGMFVAYLRTMRERLIDERRCCWMYDMSCITLCYSNV